MKTKRNNKILIIVALTMIAIAFTQSFTYYFGKYGEPGITIKNIVLLCMSFEATIGCFFLNPSLIPEDVFTFINTPCVHFVIGNECFRFWLATLYTLVAILAPLFTIYVTVSYFFKHFFWGLIDRVHKGKKERIYVFGLNKNVRSIIDKDHNYIVYCSTDTSNEFIEEMMAINVHIHQFDFSKDDSRLDYIANQIKKTDSKVFFMEDSDLKNFQLFKALNQKIGNNKKLDMYLLCEKDSMKKAIDDYSDSNKESKVVVHVFSTDDLKVNCIMKEEPVCDHIHCDQDFHAIIIGFSQHGQNLFRHVVNDAVYSVNNTISIDVFDNKLKENRDKFYSLLSKDSVERKDDSMKVLDTVSDGKLNVRFYNIDVNHYQFRETLEQLNEKIDIAYVCIDDQDQCMDALLQLKDIIITSNIPEFPVIASMPDGKNVKSLLSNYKELKKDKIDDVKFHLFEPGEYFNLKTVLEEEYENNAKKFNKMYNSLNVVSTDQPQSYLATEWESLSNFKQYSNYMVLSHQSTIHKILEEKYHLDYKGIENSIYNELGLHKEEKENKVVYSFNGTNDELVEKMGKIPVIKDICAIEHRRWCYERIFTGWEKGPKKDPRRETPCLTG